MTEQRATWTWEDIKGTVGCTYRQFDHWSRKGYIHATDNSPSTGVPRTLTWAEVDVLTLLAQLVAAGLTPAKAAPLARTLALGITATLGPFQISRAAS